MLLGVSLGSLALVRTLRSFPPRAARRPRAWHGRSHEPPFSLSSAQASTRNSGCTQRLDRWLDARFEEFAGEMQAAQEPGNTGLPSRTLGLRQDVDHARVRTPREDHQARSRTLSTRAWLGGELRLPPPSRQDLETEELGVVEERAQSRWSTARSWWANICQNTFNRPPAQWAEDVS